MKLIDAIKNGIVIIIPIIDPMISITRFTNCCSMLNPIFLDNNNGVSNKFSSSELRSRISDILGTLYVLIE